MLGHSRSLPMSDPDPAKEMMGGRDHAKMMVTNRLRYDEEFA
jgi:hypothetical protein